MKSLRVFLLGGFRVTVNDQPVTGFEADTARALLAYLVLHTNHPHRREFLAQLLWAHQPRDNGLADLRTALSRLRHALSDKETGLPLVRAGRQEIQINPQAQVWVDVGEMERLLAQVKRHRHRRLSGCPWCLSRLTEAARLYQGEFLPDLSVNSLPFSEWLVIRQEELHRLAIQVFERLADHHLAWGAYSEAEHYARRELALEPWNEGAHRRLMRTLFESGQRSAALAQYEACRILLREELGVEPSEQTTALFNEIRTTQREKTGPFALSYERSPDYLQSQKNRFPNNLPVMTTPFFGREAEIDELLERLVNPVNRLTTLVGEGGAGKTRLALASAQKLLGSFRHGVWFVPLADLAPAADVRQVQLDLSAHIALALGLSFSDQADPKTQLLSYLRDKEMLLVLDSFETVHAGAGLVHDLLRVAPHLSMLVTSRQPLKFQSETALRVGGLPLPAQANDPQAYTNGAVQLFVERANRNPDGFRLNPSNLPAVLEICRLVDGLPLGIELAAAWMDKLSPGHIAATLRQRVGWLETEQPDVPARHRSMWAVLEGSWALLNPGEQNALAALAVFRGGCTPEAAQAVSGAPPEVLASLVDKSLLQQAGLGGRYEMHDLLYQFAEEKLAALEAGASIRQPAQSKAAERYCAYYLSWVGQAGAELFGSRPHATLAQMIQEVGNLHQAWVWAAEQGRDDLMLKSLDNLAHFYRLAGLNREAVAMCEAGIAPLLPRLEGHGPPQVAALLCRLWADQAPFLVRQGEADQALARVRQALTLAEASQDAALEVGALVAVADVLHARREPEGIRTVLERAVALARSISDRRLEAHCLARLSHQVTGTTRHQEQALSLAHELEEYWLADYISVNLGGTALHLGDYSRAVRYWSEARRYAAEIGNRQRVSVLENNLGDAFRQLGAYALARECYARALVGVVERGDYYMEAHVREGLARLYRHTGELDLAWEEAQGALRLARQLNITNCVLLALPTLGRLMARRLERDAARSSYLEAIELAEALERRDLAAESHAGLAQVCLEAGDLPGAAEQTERALAVLAAVEVDAYLDVVEIYLTCCRVLRAAGDPRAPSLLDRGYRLLNERASLIADPDLRRSFLNNVPWHRELLSRYQDSA